MKVHYPNLCNMAHLFTFNAFTDFKGSNNYILFSMLVQSQESRSNQAVTKWSGLRVSQLGTN